MHQLTSQLPTFRKGSPTQPVRRPPDGSSCLYLRRVLSGKTTLCVGRTRPVLPSSALFSLELGRQADNHTETHIHAG
ncbi:unnamed protein product [Protopolystoma xenopodis]|uniref:Uncharacterized protein n=1 Tax=Protopolystoma xenopodis TaxID=117903 RepID=A0A448XRF7_9PLAT|nr:unnamed protein product [Protopolystoma xenopodis]